MVTWAFSAPVAEGLASSSSIPGLAHTGLGSLKTLGALEEGPAALDPALLHAHKHQFLGTHSNLLLLC